MRLPRWPIPAVDAPWWKRWLMMFGLPVAAGITLAAVTLLVLGEVIGTIVLCAGGIAWSIMQIRWTRRMRREIAADHQRYLALMRDVERNGG